MRTLGRGSKSCPTSPQPCRPRPRQSTRSARGGSASSLPPTRLRRTYTRSTPTTTRCGRSANAAALRRQRCSRASPPLTRRSAAAGRAAAPARRRCRRPLRRQRRPPRRPLCAHLRPLRRRRRRTGRSRRTLRKSRRSRASTPKSLPRDGRLLPPTGGSRRCSASAASTTSKSVVRRSGATGAKLCTGRSRRGSWSACARRTPSTRGCSKRPTPPFFAAGRPVMRAPRRSWGRWGESPAPSPAARGERPRPVWRASVPWTGMGL
ncbi:hypothetical protein BU14_0478s0009 [Porphyra umbilicalis]|uniref:Uncharacterized protein n=1 Tax=Porphyra umbilicalis TaxID=2786 RepID=A0A1X6NTV6_PORUM|nr:hypothetical protein BU14_0478s0009 [Porphyra umbilicalis]|eukprot:OSX72041.1 hypothetical protein BU14_0478s0009 [Porphyra umbilicalis]